MVPVVHSGPSAISARPLALKLGRDIVNVYLPCIVKRCCRFTSRDWMGHSIGADNEIIIISKTKTWCKSLGEALKD